MQAKIGYNKNFEVGRADRRLAGSFVEHLNRCMYGGLYDPKHPTADSVGFREDVKELIRNSGISLLRYPGGNFVSAYDWKDGIGPRCQRPVRYDMAWGAKETNEVGTDEFARYTKELGVELMLSVNMGTGSPKEAAELVEYCNGNSGTYYSELRRRNGSEQPYNIRLWCIGNEMDGPWQMGQMEARNYAQKYREAAKMMRSVDAGIELVACGSCSNEAAHGSFGVWDRIVLEEAYDSIDYLSLHRYYGYDVVQELMYTRIETIKDGPWMAADLTELLNTVIAAIDYVKGIRRSDHQVYISFDELGLLPHRAVHSSGIAYDVFSQYDAVLYGSLVCTLLNHADRVKINCQALVVNENGLFSAFPTGESIIQTIAYPFRDVAACTGGMVLRQAGEWPGVETEHYGTVPCAVSSCVYHEDTGELQLMIANNSLDQGLEVDLELDGFGEIRPMDHTEIYAENPHVCNDESDPGRVRPVTRMLESVKKVVLRPHSWNVLRFCEAR